MQVGPPIRQAKAQSREASAFLSRLLAGVCQLENLGLRPRAHGAVGNVSQRKLGWVPMEGGLQWQLGGCREPGRFLMEERAMGCPSVHQCPRFLPGTSDQREQRQCPPQRTGQRGEGGPPSAGL